VHVESEIFSSPGHTSLEHPSSKTNLSRTLFSSSCALLLLTGAASRSRPPSLLVQLLRARPGLSLPAGGGCAAVPDSNRRILVGQGCIVREIEHAQAILHLQVKVCVCVCACTLIYLHFCFPFHDSAISWQAEGGCELNEEMVSQLLIRTRNTLAAERTRRKDPLDGLRYYTPSFFAATCKVTSVMQLSLSPCSCNLRRVEPFFSCAARTLVPQRHGRCTLPLLLHR
jgi:hypothetical protein